MHDRSTWRMPVAVQPEFELELTVADLMADLDPNWLAASATQAGQQ